MQLLHRRHRAGRAGAGPERDHASWRVCARGLPGGQALSEVLSETLTTWRHFQTQSTLCKGLIPNSGACTGATGLEELELDLNEITPAGASVLGVCLGGKRSLKRLSNLTLSHSHTLYLCQQLLVQHLQILTLMPRSCTGATGLEELELDLTEITPAARIRAGGMSRGQALLKTLTL